MNEYYSPITIFGGGIAGLWTLNILHKHGIPAILIEKATLGGKQTLASQGMIHGGVRYALQGSKNNHSEDISQLPALWDNCLEGQGDIDLSKVITLAKSQLMWSSGGLTSKISTFFASKAMNSRVQGLSSSELPEIFTTPNSKFSGNIYCMNEVVLEGKSLVKSLSEPLKDFIYQGEVESIAKTREILNTVTVLDNKNNKVRIRSEKFIFLAGAGNEEALSMLGQPSNPDKEKLTQRRPLKQIMVKSIDFPLYAHCITSDPRPRVTVTSYPDPENPQKWIWYLGGLIALHGIDKNDNEAISFAKQELKKLFPWLNWQDKKWGTHYIDRAESYAHNTEFLGGKELKIYGNVLFGWPSKLTLAPALTSEILYELESSYQVNSPQELKEKLLKLENSNKEGSNKSIKELPLNKPEIGTLPWENANWKS